MTTPTSARQLDAAPSPYPVSLKLAVAFLAGALTASLALVQVLPKGGSTGPGSVGVTAADDGVLAGDPTALDDATGELASDFSDGSGAAATGGGSASGGATAGSRGSSASGAAAAPGAAAKPGATGGTKAKTGTGSGGGANVGGGSGSGSGSGGSGGGSLACQAGKNGGATDVGVTPTEIRLAANVVTDGAGSAFLKDAPKAMNAVMLRVNNKEGGICGRTLVLKTVNDSWDAARGRQNIEDFIQQGYFALPVMPSSEGLSAAISAGVIDRGGIPVVGTEGLRKEQYDAAGKAAWVWPVATATVAQVRVMAKMAYDRGARSFGIVYDRKYKFGVEGADAFEGYLQTLPGVTLKKRLGIEPSQSSYASEANQFTGACGPCDLVVLLLEPETGKSWMASAGQGGKGSVMTAAAQSLFNDNFARGCGSVCNGVMVFTGYNPALGPNTSKPGIAKYMSEVRAVDPSVDFTNQFTQGAYLGMDLFVEILKACSPNLTRACVRAKMDARDHASDFSAALSWRPGNHFANLGARAYSIAYSQGSFSGFRDEQTGFVRDPTPGVIS